MKKPRQYSKKIGLAKNTVRVLSAQKLAGIDGGTQPRVTDNGCFNH